MTSSNPRMCISQTQARAVATTKRGARRASCRSWVLGLLFVMGAATASAQVAEPQPQDPSPPAEGASAVVSEVSIERRFEGLMTRIEGMQRNYERDMDKAGMARLIDGQRIQQDKTMAETRAIAAEVRRVVADYRKRQMSTFDEMLSLIETAPGDESYRRNLKANYQLLLIDARDAARKAWGQEQAIAEAAEQLAEMLWASRARWSFQDRRFGFTRTADMDDFAKRMGVIRKLTMDQMAARMERQRAAQEWLKTQR